jgi:hypothetical protein
MSLPNRNVKGVIARAPVPAPQAQSQVYTAAGGLSTPIKQVGLATQTGMPLAALTSVNGDTTTAQLIVSGGGCTITTKGGKTVVTVP